MNQNDIIDEFNPLDEIYHVGQIGHNNGIHQPPD